MVMIMKKISIIVPVYNAEPYLKKCLDSLFNQNYLDYEVIAINDGSKDHSLEILRDYQKKYDNLIVIDDTNHGQGHARNLGIKNAKGSYLTFVDSDDYIASDFLIDLANKLEEDDYDIVISDLWKVYDNYTEYFKQYHNFSKNSNISFMLSHPGPVGRLFKKELFTKNNLFFKEGVYYEDLATIPLLAIYASKIAYLEHAYYYYVIHENSTMKQVKYNPKLDDIFVVLESLTEEFTYRSGKKYQKELEYLYIEHLLYSASLRYLNYSEGKEKGNQIKKIFHAMYPNYRKNEYYKKKSKKFKLVCFCAYYDFRMMLKLMKKIGGK